MSFMILFALLGVALVSILFKYGIKHFVATIAVLLTALVGAIYAYGFVQPTDHKAAVQVTMAMTPKDLWAVISDAETWPDWNPYVDSVVVETQADGTTTWLFDGSWGEVLQSVDAFEPPARLVLRIARSEHPIEGSWTMELAPDPEGVRLTMREHGSVESPFLRGFSLFQDYHATMEDVLEGLLDHLGHISDIVHVE